MPSLVLNLEFQDTFKKLNCEYNSFLFCNSCALLSHGIFLALHSMCGIQCSAKETDLLVQVFLLA